jgi:RNA polymerase sigma-70 factor (ECF subfamily)
MAWSAAFGPPGANRAVTPLARAASTSPGSGRPSKTTVTSDPGPARVPRSDTSRRRAAARSRHHPSGRDPMTFMPSTTQCKKILPDRRRARSPDDNTGVSEEAAATGDRRTELLGLYDRALPQVYGYLVSRCGGAALAEDLTAETLLAAVDAVRTDDHAPVSVPWLVGVARHKLVDHWRRQAREERGLRAVAAEGRDDDPAPDDEWDVRLDALRARHTLALLSPLHRAVLTLRYLDDLSVPDVAALVNRSVHATEGLLVRARGAFRRAYGPEEADDA